MSYSRCSRCSRHSSRWWRQWRSWAPKNFQAVGTCHTCGRAARSSCEISHLPLSPWVYPRFQGWYIQCLSYVCHVYLYFNIHTMYLQVRPKLGYHWPHLHCLVRSALFRILPRFFGSALLLLELRKKHVGIFIWVKRWSKTVKLSSGRKTIHVLWVNHVEIQRNPVK